MPAVVPQNPTGGLRTTARSDPKLVGMRTSDQDKRPAAGTGSLGVATAVGAGEKATEHGPPAAQVIDLSKTYGTGQAEVHALAGVTISFETGQFTAVMGPSGSGSSLIGGTDVTSLGDRRLSELRRDHVGFVFQSFNLVPTLTAAENITLPIDLAGRKLDKAWFDHLVGQLGLGKRLGHRPSEMPGGQQRVA